MAVPKEAPVIVEYLTFEQTGETYVVDDPATRDQVLRRRGIGSDGFPRPVRSSRSGAEANRYVPVPHVEDQGLDD